MNTVQSVERALALLNHVAGHGEWIGVRELARATGLKVPTAQNLLKTLQVQGFLEFDERLRRYRIGLAALRLAERVDPVARLADFVHPYVAQVFAEFGETVAALAWVRGEAVTVDWRQAERPLTVTAGRRFMKHPHCLATGKLLLAFQGEAFRRRYAGGEPLCELQPNSPGTVEDLLAEFLKVREQGYAEALDVQNSGVGAVAAPVFDANGAIVVALGCSAPLVRFAELQRAVVRRRLIEVAGRMSAALGADESVEEGAPAKERERDAKRRKGQTAGPRGVSLA